MTAATTLTVTEAFSSFSTNDIDATRAFYSDVLGLEVKDSVEMGLLELHTSGTTVLVYPKPNHQPATFTVLNLKVPDVEAAVDELVSRGIQFERYEGMGQDERGISTEGPRVAWFTDPTGNIVSVLQG